MARRPRRDAEMNRERLLAAAAAAMHRAGSNVPLATIAADAGVGVGTLYRSYPDRAALLRALQLRAYGFLDQLLRDVAARELSGLESVGAFLSGTLTISEQLVLPLHGAPPLVSPEAAAARQAIDQQLTAFIGRGRTEHSIRAPVNATDVIVFSALITQPLPADPTWRRTAERQVAIFLNGLAGNGPIELPGPPVPQEGVEHAFALDALPTES